MSQPNPETRVAGEREAGVICPHCNACIVRHDSIWECADCGAVHHQRCWHTAGGCGTYECRPARVKLDENVEPDVKITAEDLEYAAPFPSARPATAGVWIPPSRPAKSRTSHLAITAFVVALVGVVLVGVLTGLVAILLGSLALGSIHHTRQRGTWLAVTAVLLGIVDVVVWIVFLSVVLSRPGRTMIDGDLEPDLTVLKNLDLPISRAMRANVVVESRRGWYAAGIGSGVIVRLHEGNATIVTNRHVIDPKFSDREHASDKLPSAEGLTVKLIGQPVQSGRIRWVAPHGIDLAVISVPVYTDEARAVMWQPAATLAPGDDVFSIGNPQRLGWTHTRGTISQIRSRRRANHNLSIIQTDTAISPGNSGGGLYDKQGMLIGINTWTKDKRVSEGLSFAIAVESLLRLNPPFPQPAASPQVPGQR